MATRRAKGTAQHPPVVDGVRWSLTGGAPVKEILLSVAVAELQQRVAGRERQHVLRNGGAGPEELHAALVLPQR